MKLLIFDLLQLPVCSCGGQLSRCICKWTMSQARSSCQERQQMSQKTRRPEPIFVPREWAGKKGPHVATNISKWAEFKPVNPPSLLNMPTVSGGSFLDSWTGVTEAKPTDSSTCRHTQARFGQDCLKRGWETFSLSVLAVWALLPPISATHQPPLSSTWDKASKIQPKTVVANQTPVISNCNFLKPSVHTGNAGVLRLLSGRSSSACVCKVAFPCSAQQIPFSS